MLLRNHREFVPPQHFLERLTHILLRRRERVARSVFQRDDDDDDDDEVSRKREKTETNASSLAAREDDRLLRATAEIFRRVNAAHPVAVAARFDSGSGSSTKRGAAHVRVGARTWTPLDSDRRAGSLRERAFVDDVDGRGQTRNARDVASNGAFARGARADWNRFVALLSAARGDSEPLDALFSPFLSSVRNPAETAREADNGASSRRARANRRNAYADADFALDAKTKRRRTKTRQRREDGEEASDDADENSADSETDSDSDDDMAYAPLGVALLFTHAVDVLVQDANARVEVFESRVFQRAAEREKIAAEAAAATTTPTSGAQNSSAGADESPVPDSQPTPDARDARDPSCTDVSLPSGAWAGDLLRDALVYRLVGNHAPSDAERTRLFFDLLELIGRASRRGASDAVLSPLGAADDVRKPRSDRFSTKEKNHTTHLTTRSALSSTHSGREDASCESLGFAAASLLSAFDDVLSALQSYGATRGDRAAEKLRTQLDEARVRYFRTDRRHLRTPGAKKRFLELVNVAGGQEETRALRVVRGALREKVTARRAPGLMRPGLGVTRGAGGSLDVFRYVSDDVKDAIKCVESEDASTKRAEACDAVAHFAAAAAKAAARVVGREDRDSRASSLGTCAEAFRLTFERFAEEANAGDALTKEAAAAVDAAAGTLRCYETR